jgi:phosphonatase-like hydrolase
MHPIKLVVLDMAGTTIQDLHEVEYCFKEAAKLNQLHASDERILALQGYAKLEVFRLLWTEQLGENHSDIEPKAQQSYTDFKNILEFYYKEHPIIKTEGCAALFDYLHQNNIYIALTTGFYRKVANIILKKAGWLESLNQNYVNISNKTGIHISVTPDETGTGRPNPAMIHHAMKMLGISNPQEVINIGDTPVDLAFGRNANVRLALAVSNGTHSYDQLKDYPNDGILTSLNDLIPILENIKNEKI